MESIYIDGKYVAWFGNKLGVDVVYIIPEQLTLACDSLEEAKQLVAERLAS